MKNQIQKNKTRALSPRQKPTLAQLWQQFSNALDSALLSQCSLCQQAFTRSAPAWNHLLCHDCFKQWIVDQGLGGDPLSHRHCCKQCGLAMRSTGSLPDLICGQCLKTPPVFDYCQTLFDYDYPLQSFIANIKYQQQMLAGRKLSLLLAKQITATQSQHERPSLLIPVPQSPIRARALGFNPAELIASQLGQALDIPVQSGWVVSNPHHLPQKHLNAYERMKNMANAFELRPKQQVQIKRELKQHENIVIIDDVVTTGATAGSLAKLLKESGAKDVGVWALARTPKPKLA